MRFATLSSGAGWHVRDLERAAILLGHHCIPVDFRRISAAVGCSTDSLSYYDAVLVRTMSPGSLEQVVFRMDLLHRLHARGVRVLNPPRAVEVCVDKYMATAVLFMAQALDYDLSIPDQILIMLTTLVASVGAGGIPSGSFVTMPLIIPIILLSQVITQPDSVMATVLSMVPFFAPILMYVRIVAHTPPAWQIGGRPCGERGALSGPRQRKYLPS